MKHLALVPLIGGMAIGAERALGRPPEAVLSYDGFWGNDKFLMQWYKKRGLDIPYINLDQTDTSFSEIKVVTSLCPCSGLTSANPTHGSPCLAQNRWMLQSSAWALDKAKPEILIGENASRLYSDFGQPIAVTLREIAKFYGYWLVLYKTNTKLHGLPQLRTRSFFALYSKNKWAKGPPMIKAGPDYHTPWEGSWTEFLDTFQSCGEEREQRWAHPEMLQFVLEKDPSWFDVRHYQSALMTILDNEWADEFIERFPGKSASNVARCRAKIAAGGNVWDNSPKTVENYHPSVMYRSMTDTVHPRGTSLTSRETMRLMGLPEDMDVPKSYFNAVAQNVPTCTSEWIVRSALAATDSVPESNLIGDKILRQDNCNGKIRLGMPYGKKFALHGLVHSDLVPIKKVSQAGVHVPEKVLL